MSVETMTGVTTSGMVVNNCAVRGVITGVILPTGREKVGTK